MTKGQNHRGQGRRRSGHVSMPPQITVLIPAYNAEKTIEAALYSVLNQSVPNWEVVVADDGSTDGTLEMVAKIKQLVKQGPKIISVSLPHGGCASATHQGILRCRTDLVTILDSDDMLYPDSLEVILRRVRPQTCYMWTRFKMSTWEARQSPTLGWAKGLPAGFPTLKETFLYTGWWGGSHQRVFRRSIYLERTPHLDQRWQTAVDLQLCLLMAGTGLPTQDLSEVTYWYRRHGKQMSHTARQSQVINHRTMLAKWRRRHMPAAVV